MVVGAWGGGGGAAPLYKGLATLVLGLIALQYLFGSVLETRHWDQLFTANNITTTNRINTKIVHPLANRGFILQNLLNVTSERNSSSVSTKPVTNNTEQQETNDITIIPAQNATNNSTAAIQRNNQTSSNYSNQSLPPCPPIPPGLEGLVTIVTSPVPSVSELESRFRWLEAGGSYAPKTCQSSSVVAIIVPYRDRAEHLLLFLAHMHPFLKKQQIDYTIYIVEQEGTGSFNRAMLMNVGFTEALKHRLYDCFIFHDVDLLPEDDRNIYSCPEQPRHLSVAVDEFKYRLPYTSIFGGVSALTRSQFKTVNGFSNMFWGWGGEDDDMSNRLKYHHFHISRYPISIARYTMLKHKKEKANPKRYETLSQGKKRFNSDGLNSLKYTVKQTRFNQLYTWLLVELHTPGS